MSTDSRLKNLETKMDIVILTLQRIENNLREVKLSCNTMDEHIDFIESVYTTVRSPLDYIMSRTRYLMSSSDESGKSLPNIE